MPDEAPSLAELRERAEAARQDLATAEAVEAARPSISPGEASAIFEAGMKAHAAAQTSEEKHDAAEAALRQLEDGRHKGREIDILAQHVLDARTSSGTKEEQL